MIKLFITAYFQVALITANTWFISREAWAGVAVCGFGISYLWSMNVRRISISSGRERIVYSTGAMLGGISGLLVGKLIKML
ncbi:MAG: hypothetical protein KGZ82_10740 [Bacteroidales bacterium]|nr:hypothetical protein [Bacteroidales bacterium]